MTVEAELYRFTFDNAPALFVNNTSVNKAIHAIRNVVELEHRVKKIEIFEAPGNGVAPCWKTVLEKSSIDA